MTVTMSPKMEPRVATIAEVNEEPHTTFSDNDPTWTVQSGQPPLTTPVEPATTTPAPFIHENGALFWKAWATCAP